MTRTGIAALIYSLRRVDRELTCLHREHPCAETTDLEDVVRSSIAAAQRLPNEEARTQLDVNLFPLFLQLASSIAGLSEQVDSVSVNRLIDHVVQACDRACDLWDGYIKPVTPDTSARDEPHQPAEPSPPQLDTKLERALVFLLSSRSLGRLGQIEEDYPSRLERLGSKRAADIWFWKELAMMLAPLTLDRLKGLATIGWVAKGIEWFGRMAG